jgi:hypothetical protein
MDDTTLKTDAAETVAPPVEIPTPCCANCWFFFPAKDGKSGSCRRHAPTPIVVGMRATLTGTTEPVIDGYFPPTNPSIVCGDHPLYGRWVQDLSRRAVEQRREDERAKAENEAAGHA